VNAIIVSLQSLIITVKKNFFHSFATVIMLLSVIVAWSARGNIATFLERNPTAEQEKGRFDQSIVADAQINGALEDIRRQINADRILIRQFHNSKTDLTGLPFASVSTTYVAMAPGVTLTPGSYDPYPLASINEVLARMFTPNEAPHCARLTIDDIVDPAYRKLIESNGVALWYNCPIMNLRGQPIGFILASYMTITKDHPVDDKIEAILGNTGERVVGYLDNVIKQEKRPWYEAIFGGSEGVTKTEVEVK
jgi:hypothetical protein